MDGYIQRIDEFNGDIYIASKAGSQYIANHSTWIGRAPPFKGMPISFELRNGKAFKLHSKTEKNLNIQIPERLNTFNSIVTRLRGEPILLVFVIMFAVWHILPFSVRSNLNSGPSAFSITEVNWKMLRIDQADTRSEIRSIISAHAQKNQEVSATSLTRAAETITLADLAIDAMVAQHSPREFFLLFASCISFIVALFTLILFFQLPEKAKRALFFIGGTLILIFYIYVSYHRSFVRIYGNTAIGAHIIALGAAVMVAESFRFLTRLTSLRKQ